MLYCGVDVQVDGFTITVLTDGFANLGTRYFRVQEYDSMLQWIASLQSADDEPCSWFFDEQQFYNEKLCASIFNFEDNFHTLYTINHRKLANIMQFFGEWFVSTSFFFLGDIDVSFVLASSIRLFDAEYVQRTIAVAF